MQNAIDRMTRELAAVLGGKLWGVWLYGSVVLGDFRPGWSDIDFIALTDEPITGDEAERLLPLRQTLLEREPENPYYRAFEGIIAEREEYRRGAFSRLVYWGTSGQRVTDRYKPDAFSRWELAEKGRAVYGGEPWPFPAPEREELTEAVRAHYESIQKNAAQTGESLYSCGWLLDIARCVYTLRTGGVVGKTQAGRWALQERLFPDEAPLRRTLAIREDPLAYKNLESVKEWLKGLGPVVQQYADVLERELEKE